MPAKDKILEVDTRLQEEEASAITEEEKKYRDEALKNLKPEQRGKLTDLDHLQIVRGYQTDEPRMQVTIDAYKMIQDWRDSVNYDDVLSSKLETTEKFHNDWKETIYGNDKYGHPLIGFTYSGIDTDAVASLSERDLEIVVSQKLASYTYMKMQNSKKTGVQRYKQTFVIDMKGGGSGLLNGKRRNTVKKVMDIGSDYFPESVWRIYVVNTPMLLRGGWAIVKPWLHPVTQAKVNICSSVKDAVKKMKELDGYEDKDLPEWMEGTHKGTPAYEVVQTAIEAFRADKEAKEAAKVDGDEEEEGDEETTSDFPGAATATEEAKGTML